MDKKPFYDGRTETDGHFFVEKNWVYVCVWLVGENLG